LVGVGEEGGDDHVGVSFEAEGRRKA